MTQKDPPPLTMHTPVILVGGGDVDPRRLKELAALNYPIIAADGGANILKTCGLTPIAIIGDLDSLENIEDWKTQTDVHYLADQNTTDFEKCLTAIDAPLYLCLGFWSSDLGHSLASLHLIARFQAAKNIVIFSKTDTMFATREELNLALAPDQPLSIYPLEPVTFASSTGLLYPLNGLFMQQGTYIGTSNATNASSITITPTKDNQGTYLTVIPIEFWRQFATYS